MTTERPTKRLKAEPEAPKTLKLVIAGSRELKLRPDVIEEYVVKFFKDTHNISEVVSGTCEGVDQCGETWADLAKIPIKRFPADWTKLPKVAGVIRNTSMANYADAGIVFMKRGEETSGSLDMLKKLERKRKPVFKVLI